MLLHEVIVTAMQKAMQKYDIGGVRGVQTLDVVREKLSGAAAVALMAEFSERTVAFLRADEANVDATLREQSRKGNAIAGKCPAAGGDGVAQAKNRPGTGWAWDTETNHSGSGTVRWRLIPRSHPRAGSE